jgi:tetratricopeptide (TPR) repeat protein
VGDSWLDPTLIAHQLARISDSSHFRSAGRLREFLNYIVMETLGGREQSIKEYTIGTQVYGRNESFNPKSDSIVRVEAVKLRSRLDAYYSEQGKAYVLARAGKREDAEQIFDRLTTAPPYGYVSPLQLGAVSEALNRREEAAAHLAHAQRENAWGLIWSNVDPRVKRIYSPV